MSDKICSVESCNTKVLARSWCAKHYARWRAHGDSEYEVPVKICSIEGCNNKFYVRGWCIKHYQRWRAHGDPTKTVWDVKEICHVDECERQMVARNMCAMHYKRWDAYGTPLVKGHRPRGMTMEETIQWFWDHKIIDENDCWIQEEVKPHPKGYVNIYNSDSDAKIYTGLHRLSYAYHYASGTLESGRVIHHKCANAGCYNPEHLQLVEPKENGAEMLHRRKFKKEISQLI